MAQQKMRRLAVGREVFSEVALLSDKARQTFYTEITRFRMGSAVSMKTLTGASVYEQVRLDGGISIIMKRIGDLFLASGRVPIPWLRNGLTPISVKPTSAPAPFRSMRSPTP